MTYRREQRRKLLRRFVAQQVWGDAEHALAKQLPAFTGRRRVNRDIAVAQHPLRMRRTVLGSLRSSNPQIRAAAKGLAVRSGLLAKPTPKATGWRRPRPTYTWEG